MLNASSRSRFWGQALALTLLLTAAARADSWVRITPDGSLDVQALAQAQSPRIDVPGYDENGIRVTITTPGVALLPYKTDNGDFVAVTWPDAAPFGEIGAPLLPVVRRLFIVPLDAVVSMTVVLGDTAMIDGTTLGVPLRVPPRQAPIEKLPGARENAPFDFDEAAYAIDADYLADAVTIEELGIARGQRIFMLEAHPVAYNPVAQTITYRSRIDVDIKFTGGSAPSDLNHLRGLDQIVLNPDRNAGTRGTGNYLIVTPETFESQIAPFAVHKASKGFNVSTYVTSTSSATVIRNYILSLWETEDAPEYILLVGDTQFIGYFSGGGSGSPATDLPYTCMDGSYDWYPDIAIGRFPVDNASELTAVLDKTVYYDNAAFSDPDYLLRATFMASEDNYWVSEGTHNWVINNHMTPNDYVSDKLYCHTYNATTQDVRDSFNDGRFFGVFSGHGASTYWYDGPLFYQSDVNGLTNANMYSLILSFSCSTGAYTIDECFTETWILAPNKGAVGIWGSTVSSYWTEDDVLEKRWFDSIFDEEDEVPAEFGPTCNDTRMRYMAEMGSGSTTRRYFEMYNLLGDPSLVYPTGGPQPPSARDDDVSTPVNTPLTITLLATDDGLPEPPSLEFTVDSLPTHGVLSEPDGTPIDSVPYTLPDGSNAVVYTPDTWYLGDDEFQFYADDGGVPPEGGCSNVATIVVHVTPPPPELVINFPLDSDPGWSTQGQWEFGQPIGGGSHGGDPFSGYTGNNVYAYNLAGDYTNNMPAYYLTTTAIDCTDLLLVELKFRCWLGVERVPYDHATVEVSNDGTNWTPLWANSTSTISDEEWVEMVFDISAVADDQPTVYVRWGMGSTDDGITYFGWNIDDVEIWAVDRSEPCFGDLDGDGDIDLADLAQLLSNYGMTSGAVYEDGDLDEDGDVDLADLAALLAVYGTVCD